jgi:hypothetical protein
MKLPTVLILATMSCAAITGAALVVHLRTPHFVQGDVEKILVDQRAGVVNRAIEGLVVDNVSAIIVAPRRVVGYVSVTIGDIHVTPSFHCDMGEDWHYICVPDHP